MTKEQLEILINYIDKKVDYTRIKIHRRYEPYEEGNSAYDDKLIYELEELKNKLIEKTEDLENEK